MSRFDFIAAREFRESLEVDHAEMLRCSESESWKAVQVLAGSIVETLLVDYLVSTSATRTGKDPLRLDLAEAIETCKKEGALSQRAADLCSVIRSYRNLIHPGRMIRLGEAQPDRASASIAVSLVDVIVNEVSVARRAAVGLSAEQVVSKLERDPNSIHILKHLLDEVSPTEQERFLIEALPAALERSLHSDNPFDDNHKRMGPAFRLAFDQAESEIKKKVAGRYVKLLREGSADEIERYSDAFFRATDLAHIDQQQHGLVLDHLLSRVASPKLHTEATLSLWEGSGKHVRPTDAVQWFDSYVRTIISSSSVALGKEAKERLLLEFFLTSGDVEARILKRCDDWMRHFAPTTDKAIRFAELKKDLDDLSLPF